MTLQDFSANRERIIKLIAKIAPQAEAKIVMERMVKLLTNPDYSVLKPTAGNIDKITRRAVELWAKLDYKPFTNPDGSKNWEEYNDFLDRQEAEKRSCMSSFR